MPVGNPIYFEGNILDKEVLKLFNIGDSNGEKIPFGFFECEIEAPKNLKHPILQLRLNKKRNN